jgi:hypothetical protein
MFYIQLFGDAFEGEEKTFDLAATRFESVELAIQGTLALAARALFPFDRAEGFRVVDGVAHRPVHEGIFAALSI